jgi:hypothetical protein
VLGPRFYGADGRVHTPELARNSTRFVDAFRLSPQQIGLGDGFSFVADLGYRFAPSVGARCGRSPGTNRVALRPGLLGVGGAPAALPR